MAPIISFGNLQRSNQTGHSILHMSQETDSEQESEDSSDSDGDNKEVCKVNKKLGQAICRTQMVTVIVQTESNRPRIWPIVLLLVREIMRRICYLVGGLEHVLVFNILGMSSSEWRSYIFQRGKSTTKQL